MSEAVDLRRSNASLLLALLLVAYIFNYLDRQILGILAGSIITDLRLSDRQFGALSGPPFAILYSVLGIPFAYLADRTSRSRVIAAAVAFWSAFTGLCGIATSFWQFFFFRMGVGIGEAGGVAPSYALIADYFEPRRRARALAIFSLGVPIGLALGTLLGAGVPLINGLNVARRSIGNQILVDAVSNSIERVKEGKPLGPSLGDCRTLFSGSVREMISVAEESGRLDAELVRIANVTEGDLDRQLKAAVAMAEPLMLFLIAGFIGTIFIGMVIPIFTLQDYIK